MKMTVIGAGHIGLVTALSFAHFDHEVLCVDVDIQKINLLNEGICTIYEPDLEKHLNSSRKKNKIYFSSEYSDILQYSDVIFICIGTPTLQNKGCDLSILENSIAQISSLPQKTFTIVIKSTVPPGTQAELFRKFPQFQFVSSPEFLREGQAFKDALQPDRLIAGTSNKAAIELLRQIYLPFLKSPDDFLVMDPKSAEVAKYAANSFLATRISLINEFSRLCEKVGANIQSVAHSLAKDHRIGPHFLNAGLGYGGSCFPKDLQALVQFAKDNEEEMSIVSAVQETNERQILLFSNKITQELAQNSDQVVCIWGVAFKPDTNDVREAPSLKIIELLLRKGYLLHIYDPKANDNIANHFFTHPHFANLHFFEDKMSALKNADALVILTEWSEFYEVSMKQIKHHLKQFVIFDGRNVLAKKENTETDLCYSGIGLSV